MPKMIGFDATEGHRMGTFDARTTCLNCFGKGKTRSGAECGPCRGTGDLLYDVRYPLREWGWDRRECERQIQAAGLPVPVKSACFFCPASKKREIDNLEPELFQLSATMEKNYINGKHYRSDGTKGLGRRFAWTDYRGGPTQLDLFG